MSTLPRFDNSIVSLDSEFIVQFSVFPSLPPPLPSKHPLDTHFAFYWLTLNRQSNRSDQTKCISWTVLRIGSLRNLNWKLAHLRFVHSRHTRRGTMDMDYLSIDWSHGALRPPSIRWGWWSDIAVEFRPVNDWMNEWVDGERSNNKDWCRKLDDT